MGVLSTGMGILITGMRVLVMDPDEIIRQVIMREEDRLIIENLSRAVQMLVRLCLIFIAILFLYRGKSLPFLHSFFFEFPNNLRHLCTTMPWSIWPVATELG